MTERSIADQINFCEQQGRVAVLNAKTDYEPRRSLNEIRAEMFRSIAETLRQLQDPTRAFIAKLNTFDWLAAPEVVLEPDGDIGFDWTVRKDATVSAHVSAEGRAGWAALVGDYKSYGSFQWPDWPEELTQALRLMSEAEVEPRPDPAPWQEPQMEELIAIYEEIKSLWAAMCFDWMFAPENMKREAHGQIRDGLNEVARRLFQIVGPALKAEFTEASRLAREAAALPVPPERPPAERQDP